MSAISLLPLYAHVRLVTLSELHVELKQMTSNCNFRLSELSGYLTKFDEQKAVNSQIHVKCCRREP